MNDKFPILFHSDITFLKDLNLHLENANFIMNDIFNWMFTFDGRNDDDFMNLTVFLNQQSYHDKTELIIETLQSYKVHIFNWMFNWMFVRETVNNKTKRLCFYKNDDGIIYELHESEIEEKLNEHKTRINLIESFIRDLKLNN